MGFKKCGTYNNEISRCGGRKTKLLLYLAAWMNMVSDKEMVSDQKSTYCIIPFI